MKVLVTGAAGFIGKNLTVHLAQRRSIEVMEATRETPQDELRAMAAAANFVFHLAGVNRPPSTQEFSSGNVDFTRFLCDALANAGNSAPVVFASSIQASLDNPYGRSKKLAEDVLSGYGNTTGATVSIFRLPNVFGKWCRPNYNSVVATFCHNMARGLPVEIHDPSRMMQLVHVDDVVRSFVDVMDRRSDGTGADVSPVYEVTVGELARSIQSFRNMRSTLLASSVGVGFMRALYSTYVSYLPPQDFSYPVPKYGDARGVFVEMLKTESSGQFSYFTAHPGVTRGIHFHHTKTEKFLVIQGRARFRFQHIVTGERLELQTSGESPQIVETVPGWSHDITNIGEGEMIVMLWANEIFDRENPDTFSHPVW